MKEEIEQNEKINHNQIIEIQEENKNKEKINDEDIKYLLYFINNTKEEKSKIKSEEAYEFLIKYINKLNDEQFFPFFNYLDNIGISILKILINGFIEHETDEKQEQNIFKIINKLISFYFNKNTYDFIYEKLSLFYRKHDTLIKNISSIRKFEKVFNIWKYFYNIENSYENVKNENISNIVFYNEINKKNKNLSINFGEKLKYDDTKKATQIYRISIKFISSTILDLNKFIENFSFIKIIYNNEFKFKINYNDIFNEYNSIVDSLSKVHEIIFEIYFSNIIISINGKKLENKTFKIEYNRIQKMKILNNFLGEISFVEVAKDFLLISDTVEKETLIVNIIKNDSININDNKFIYKILYNNKEINNKNNELVKIDGEIFSNKYLNNSNNKVKKNNKIDLNDLRYYGGLNCFIPLFKLINYVINELKNMNNNYKENEENKEYIEYFKNNINIYINKSLNWIKDILQIMIKMICLSKNNFINFQNIIISLIGSIAEIKHTLIDLASSNIITNDQISSLFKDEIFFVYFIIILNSTFPNNVKKIFNDLFEIINNFQNFKFTMNQIIFDKNNIKNLDWYFLFLFNFIVFILLYFDSIEMIPRSLVEHLNQIYKKKEVKKNTEKEDDINMLNTMKPFFNFIDSLINQKDDLENTKNKFPNYYNVYYKNNYYNDYVIYLIKTFINAKNVSINIPINLNSKKNLIAHIKDLIAVHIFDPFNIPISKEINCQLIINEFKYFIDDLDFLQKLFDFLVSKHFLSQEELILNELIDYHGQYHHLMKELFIFNRQWSNKKLFFKNSLKEIKKSGLKYKNINYYTKNFQRPIIYPTLDYRYHYPEFSKFEIKNDKFYNYEETEDYNFELICPELDNLIQKYDEDIIEKRKKNGKINIFTNVCLVKQTYHVKGNLLIINNYDNKIVYFYSSSYNKSNTPTCNKSNNNLNEKDKDNNKDLCYGSIFKCPNKEVNRKIRIDFKNIRLIMKRIYYYRMQAIEIFTQTKSYYFNFLDKQNYNDFFSLFLLPFKDSYFLININDELFGFKKKNSKEMDYYNKGCEHKNFIDFLSNHISKDVCIFDIIILINLLSNRSFNDLHQYPVFPLLYIYDKISNYNKVPRILNKHIGFQNITKGEKDRLKLYNNSFKDSVIEIEETKNDEIPYYFNTHYSNIVYTCNYLIRIFPFSFAAIEMQGDGFDAPNRLFFSIQQTFYNISTHKSDIRELIPEFFYLPEMFMNINNINFHKKTDNVIVDDVIMPEDLPQKTISNIITNDDNKQEKFFIFVERNKNNLESLKDNINGWIKIIFGTGQRYNKKKEQYFRSESYIDNKNNINEQYLKDELILKSVEFGLIPLKIFDKNLLLKINKTNYEKLDEETKNKIKKELKIQTYTSNNKKIKVEKENEKDKEKMKDNNLNEIKNNNIIKDSKDDWKDELNIKIKHFNEGDIGKLEIYENDILINEIIDHNNKIIDSFYNKRLNMFASTSYDGFLCVYILPKKLISMIKHPNNSYYDKVLLSSNPFPSIIAFDKKENILTSYSLSGIIIKSLKLKGNLAYKINHKFNVFGGTFRDRIYLYLDSGEYQIINVPFFDIIKEDQLHHKQHK